jgi:hypothetical protein
VRVLCESDEPEPVCFGTSDKLLPLCLVVELEESRGVLEVCLFDVREARLPESLLLGNTSSRPAGGGLLVSTFFSERRMLV